MYSATSYATILRTEGGGSRKPRQAIEDCKGDMTLNTIKLIQQ